MSTKVIHRKTAWNVKTKELLVNIKEKKKPGYEYPGYYLNLQLLHC